MGKTAKIERLSDAAGGRAVGRLVARSALNLVRDESGATAIEYSLIVTLICMAIIGGLTAFADGSKGVFDKIDTSINGVL